MSRDGNADSALTVRQVALQIQFIHHTMCAFLVALLYFNVARDGSQFFTHMKFSIGLVLFYTYTHVMVPVLLCE